VCSISGTTLSFAAPGSCVVNANQGGNASYLAAMTVPRIFTVTVPAPTPSPANGKVLYNTAVSGLSCANCHGAMATLSNVGKGANNPTVIANAINPGGVAAMAVFQNKFTAKELADIAAFIGAPF
jgi:mono/diheme cytochrome c family protein